METVVTLTMNPALDIATATDRVIPTHKLRCAVPRYDPGGGGINVARAVRALGGEAAAIFPAGGAAGEMIRRMLELERVPHHPIAISGFTRESLSVEERLTGQQYRFILPGPEIAEPDQRRCLEALAHLAPGASYVVASGSLPPGVPEDFYGRVAALTRKLGKRLVLDTSGPALRKAGGGIYLMKPSLRELAELTECEIDTPQAQEQAARRLVELGRCEIVILSLGAEGALLVTARETRRFAAIPVKAKSTVGAGDSMLAGVILALSRGMPLGDAVRYGMAAGAAALLGSGTALCHRDAVERLYAEHSYT